MARSAYIAAANTDAINTTVEAKAHLRVDFTDDDTYINSLCLAAKETIENYCNLKLMDTDIVQYCDIWEETKNLYFSPTLNSGDVSVTSITYYDSDNAQQTWASTEYIVNKYAAPAEIALEINKTYPSISGRVGGIAVSYSVGTTASADIPDQLKQAALILIGNMYENRQEIIVGRSVGSIPMTARYLMNPYKIQTLGQC